MLYKAKIILVVPINYGLLRNIPIEYAWKREDLNNFRNIFFKQSSISDKNKIIFPKIQKDLNN